MREHSIVETRSLTSANEIDQLLPLIMKLSEFHNTLNPNFANFYPLTPVEEIIALIKNGLEDGTIKVWATFINQELCAFCQTTQKNGVGKIDRLFVAEKARKKGLASHLLKLALEVLEKQNLQRIEITVVQGNENAKQLYEKFGFRERTFLMTKVEE